MAQHFHTGTSAWGGFSGEEFERKAAGMAKARGYWPAGFHGLPAYALPAIGQTCGKLEWAAGTQSGPAGTGACV
jgi:hypothetical protein